MSYGKWTGNFPSFASAIIIIIIIIKKKKKSGGGGGRTGRGRGGGSLQCFSTDISGTNKPRSSTETEDDMVGHMHQR